MLSHGFPARALRIQPWVQLFVSCAYTREAAANAARKESALKIIVEVVVTGVVKGRRGLGWAWASTPDV